MLKSFAYLRSSDSLTYTGKQALLKGETDMVAKALTAALSTRRGSPDRDDHGRPVTLCAVTAPKGEGPDMSGITGLFYPVSFLTEPIVNPRNPRTEGESHERENQVDENHR